MSDCEKLCWENSERRRHAEEHATRELMQIRNAETAARRETELKMWRKWDRGTTIMWRIHLAVSMALALVGLRMWSVMGLFGALFYYTCAWLARRMCDE